MGGLAALLLGAAGAAARYWRRGGEKGTGRLKRIREDDGIAARLADLEARVAACTEHREEDRRRIDDLTERLLVRGQEDAERLAALAQHSSQALAAVPAAIKDLQTSFREDLRSLRQSVEAFLAHDRG